MAKHITETQKCGKTTKVIKLVTTPSVYGVGLVSLDIVVSSNPIGSSHQWAGGTCGNVLTILAYLGWKSFPIARMNGDSASSHVKSDMAQWGVKLDFAELPPTTNTPIITQEISMDKNGVPTHKFHWKNCPKCGAWLPNYKPVTLSATKVIKPKIKSANVFFFDRVSPGALDLAKHFRGLGAVIVFEPSAKTAIKPLKEALSLADIVKYSNTRVISALPDIKGHTSAFLEIQTLGSNGLRYRSHLKSKLSKKWKSLPAFPAGVLKDTCGCGDWTTAGLIAKLCDRKSVEITMLTEDKVTEALKYGQALAAWNCNFEGARGGMYRVSKTMFNKDIQQILLDGAQKRIRHSHSLLNEMTSSVGSCPSCPH